RPNSKRDALYALVDNGLRAELLVAGEMVAFDQEVDVQFAEHWRKAVDILKLVPVSAPLHAQTVTERFTAFRQSDEEPVRMQPNTLCRNFAGVHVDDIHRFGAGQYGTDIEATRRLMHAQKGERVGMPCLDDRLNLGIEPLQRQRRALALAARGAFR